MTRFSEYNVVNKGDIGETRLAVADIQEGCERNGE